MAKLSPSQWTQKQNHKETLIRQIMRQDKAQDASELWKKEIYQLQVIANNTQAHLRHPKRG